MEGVHAFTVAGIPVHFSLTYFLLLLFMMQGGLEAGLVWAVAITTSILVHELGHALVARQYRLSPSITIHGFGGLCHHERASRDLHDALIIAAGPGAGLALGFLVLGVSWLVGPDLIAERPLLSSFVLNLLYVNIGWSLVNLLPLWPLDGGQLFRLGLLKLLRPALAENVTHVVGAALGLAAAFAAWTLFGRSVTLLIAALLIWQNLSRIGSTTASGAIRGTSRRGKELLARAQRAYDAREWAEASRLAHQAKAEIGVVDGRTLERMFEILGVSGAALGDHEAALSYLARAGRAVGRVYVARVECVLALRVRGEAAALLANPEAAKLPDRARRDLEALAHS